MSAIVDAAHAAIVDALVGGLRGAIEGVIVYGVVYLIARATGYRLVLRFDRVDARGSPMASERAALERRPDPPASGS